LSGLGHYSPRTLALIPPLPLLIAVFIVRVRAFRRSHVQTEAIIVMMILTVGVLGPVAAAAAADGGNA